jgi:hypothetical protein
MGEVLSNVFGLIPELENGGARGFGWRLNLTRINAGFMP